MLLHMPWSPRQARFVLAVFALLFTMLSGLLVPTAVAAAPPDPTAPAAVVSYDGVSAARADASRKSAGSALRRMLRLVNVARAVPQLCGDERMAAAPPVRRNKRLGRAARKYARKMARKDWFDHNSPNGDDPGDRISAEDYQWSRWGENIAAGYDGAASVVAGWLASPGHCRTLMGPYRHVGFGHAYDSDSTFGHYWVQDFASPR